MLLTFLSDIGDQRGKGEKSSALIIPYPTLPKSIFEMNDAEFRCERYTISDEQSYILSLDSFLYLYTTLYPANSDTKCIHESWKGSNKQESYKACIHQSKHSDIFSR